MLSFNYEKAINNLNEMYSDKPIQDISYKTEEQIITSKNILQSRKIENSDLSIENNNNKQLIAYKQGFFKRIQQSITNIFGKKNDRQQDSKLYKQLELKINDFQLNQEKPKQEISFINQLVEQVKNPKESVQSYSLNQQKEKSIETPKIDNERII